MSLLQHRDESFRNITATWGGLQRSQAALICSAGKTSPPCPSPALLPPGQRVSRDASERWHKPTRTGHEKESKEWALKKKNQHTSPCSQLIAAVRAVGLGLLRDRMIQLPPDRQHLQTARGSRGWTAVPCTGGSDGHVRQNQITPKYRLGGFLQVVQIQPYKIWGECKFTCKCLWKC